MDEVDVSLLVVAADVIGLAGGAFFNDLEQRSAVVFDVQPVADVFAFAIDGDRFSSQAFENHDRDQFFRELIRAVVVAAVGDHDGQTVCVLPSSGKVVRGRFAGGVRRMGIVRRRFTEQSRLAEAAVDLVGGDVQEAEAIFGSAIE